MSSQSPPKKRKHHDAHSVDDSAHKAKKPRKHRDKKESRRSSRRHHDSEFVHVEASLVAAVPPIFATNLAPGVLEMLDSMLMRYIPPLRGVVLAHSDLRFLDSKAEIKDDSPFAVCRVAFAATVWSPRIGQRLTGRIILSSPDHVALLVHRIFNAAIPASRLPRDVWEFVASTEPDGDDVNMADGGDGDDTSIEPHSTGQWVHKHTREPLGGPARTLDFTVISLTVANQMLSLVGSILPDPFAPPQQTSHSTVEAVAQDGADAEREVDADEEDLPEDPLAVLGPLPDAITPQTTKPKKKDKHKDKNKDTGNDGDEARRQKKHKHKHKHGHK